MPKRTDIKRIMVIGSGPIVIGQACEFDYSGTQCCKVLMEEGYEAILVNSNPATIMTDPSMATRTYVEPITLESVERIIEIERPDALISTMGGQNGLNCGIALAENGVLERYGVEMIGCDAQAIARGEDRKLFVEAMESVGLQCARSGYAYSVEDALALADDMGYPLVLRPSFTLGGAGGGIAYNAEELAEIVSQGLDLSQNGEVLVEESVLGWKEIEMEVMRDNTGACITVCSIENVDPMGVHTGDSITVAPAMTLTEKEYDVIEQASYDIIRAVGVNGSGANIQFAVNPEDGRVIVIEMNPRVSRSSALASKATGFPIAKIATKLAIGYTFEEIENDITGMPVSNPITIDYVVVKVPRFAFEKFKGTDDTLTTRMKAVGEVMSIGRTFEEAMGKAMRSLEKGRYGLSADGKDQIDDSQFNDLLSRPTENRIYYVTEALQRGWSVEKLYEITRIDPWFLNRIADVVAVEEGLRGLRLEDVDADMLRTAKRYGLSDRQIAYLTNAANCVLAGEPAMATGERMVRTLRKALGVKPTFKIVDTCSGMLDTATNYFYKTYEETSEVRPSDKPRAMILGAGPNRIGQGIEFDYCCVHASYALADMGYETVMVNCNPETVSTDYDTSDRLYFEPLTYEDVMDIVDAEDPAGVVVTLGGQTPLKLAHELEEAGVEIMGTKPEAIDLAEDRDRFSKVLDELGILYPAAGLATSPEEALRVAQKIGFPLLVRPSYVLGGRGMVIAYDEDYLMRHLTEAAMVTPDHPVYLDHFLEDAIEVDVDALCDGTDVYIGGILEHIEEAGIHSGDSSCCMPPFSLAQPIVEKLRDHTRRLALRLGVRGLLNVQYGIKDTNVYVIEANPRASRTVPFVSKASGVPLAKCAARIMAGETIASLVLPPDDRELDHYSVKEAVLPFSRFPGVDVILGPEMKSTGEVMGIARDFPAAYAKAALAIDYSLPTSGTAFISVNDRDKRNIVSVANELKNMGFHLVSTSGTARTLAANGIPVQKVNKFHEEHPNIGDMIEQGQVDLMVNTPMGQETRGDGYHLRTAAVRHQVCYATTISGATAMTHAIEAVQEEYDVDSEHRLKPIALQDLERFEIG